MVVWASVINQVVFVFYFGVFGDFDGDVFQEFFDYFYYLVVVFVGNVDFYGGEFWVVGVVYIFILEYFVDFVYVFKFVYDEVFEVKFVSNLYVEWYVECIVVCFEGLGCCFIVDRLQNRCFYFQLVMVIEEMVYG